MKPVTTGIYEENNHHSTLSILERLDKIERELEKIKTAEKLQDYIKDNLIPVHKGETPEAKPIGVSTGTTTTVFFNPQETELKELPEKWCIKNYKPVLSWLRKFTKVNENNYYIFPSNDSGNNSCFAKPENYTEISFSDFGRLVLKNEQNELQNIKLQVGEWYKDLGGTSVVCITKLPDADNENFSGYGLDNGVWFNDNNIKNEPIWLKCDLEHVRQALINYAKPTHGEGNYYIGGVSGDWDFGKNFIPLMQNGVWMHEVESPKEQPKEIDWSVPMLVESDEYIIQTTGCHKLIPKTFSGIVIKNKAHVNMRGQYSNNWSKSLYTPVTEPITINS